MTPAVRLLKIRENIKTIFMFPGHEAPVGYAPDHDHLYAIAESQDGYFTVSQAGEAGFSPQLVQSHLSTGNFERVARGIYRLVRFPASEQADLIVFWLWSRQEGIFSHQTVLALHGLSDVMPSKTHLTLPAPRATQTRKVPRGLALHFADVPDDERAWHGAVPVTSAARAIADCIEAFEVADVIAPGIAQALARGLVTTVEAARLGGMLAAREAP